MLRTRIRAGAVAGVVVALVFELALSVLQSFDIFIESWTPEIGRTTPIECAVSDRIRQAPGCGVEHPGERVRLRLRGAGLLADVRRPDAGDTVAQL